MTRDDALRLWAEAWHPDDTTDETVAKFAALVAQAEREACAEVCEQTNEDGEGPDCWDWHSKDYAAAIRARAVDQPGTAL